MQLTRIDKMTPNQPTPLNNSARRGPKTLGPAWKSSILAGSLGGVLLGWAVLTHSPASTAAQAEAAAATPQRLALTNIPQSFTEQPREVEEDDTPLVAQAPQTSLRSRTTTERQLPQSNLRARTTQRQQPQFSRPQTRTRGS